jgi:endonuclease YncB( thermonuclease family)
MQFGDKYLATIVGACAVGVGIGVLLVNSFGRVESQSAAFDQPPPAPVTQTKVNEKPAPPPAPELGAHAVEKVLTGDTVVLEGVGQVRLLGVDAVHLPAGKSDPNLSRVMLQQIVEGKVVGVECDPASADTDFKDENGNYLAYLMLEDGVIVNTELLARGGAVADLDRAATRRDELVRAERDARWNSRGLWQAAGGKTVVPIPPSDIAGRRPLDVAPPVQPGKDDVLVTSDGRFHKASC